MIMIYWFKNLPPKSFDDNVWKPVIPYKWLRKNFMVAVYVLQFLLLVIFMIYVKNIQNVMKGDLNLQISIPQSLIYISLIAIIIIHEMLHIAVIFNKGDFSITFHNLFFWIATNAELSKLRYFIFIFLPLLILTVIPFIISLFIFNDLKYILKIYSLFNLLISSADVINTVFVLSKPNKAIFDSGMYHVKT